MPPISIESQHRAAPLAASLQSDLLPLLVIAAADILVVPLRPILADFRGQVFASSIGAKV